MIRISKTFGRKVSADFQTFDFKTTIELEVDDTADVGQESERLALLVRHATYTDIKTALAKDKAFRLIFKRAKEMLTEDD